jgi:SulP family sulfate permease
MPKNDASVTSHLRSELARHPAAEYQLAPRHGPLRLAGHGGAFAGIPVLRDYRAPWLRPDLFAGLAVAAYLIPQVMAYAAIINVPPVTGLWTALAALVVYALMGSSRVLSVGPESTVALMTAAAVAPLAGGDPGRAAALAAALSLVVAGWLMLARLLRLGVLADLLSHPLLVGYLAGGATLMVVGQLGHLSGTRVHGDSIMAQLASFAAVAGATQPLTAAVGAGTLAVLLAVRRLRPNWPAPLLAVAAATAVGGLTHLAGHGVAVVGEVPAGLPLPHLPAVSWSDVQSLLVAGLGVAIVAYGDNTLIARGFPAPEPGPGEPAAPPLDPQQELVSLSGVHIVSGLLGGFPASSSGSRTALALAAGARTQVYSLISALCVLVVLFAAGPLLRGLPEASLGAVVLYAASKLVSWGEFTRLARFRRSELVLAVTAALGTVCFGILIGVGVAVALSLLEMARRLARPHEGVLGRVPGLAGMHDVADYPEAATLPGLVVYRYDAPLFFANVGDLRARAVRVVEQENAAFPAHPVRWLLLNVEANVEIDITAADGLRGLHADLDRLGVRLGLARVKQDLLAPLERAGLLELIGADLLFPTLPVAEEAYLAWAAGAELSRA